MTLTLIPTIYKNFKHLFPRKCNIRRLNNVQLFLTWTVKCPCQIWDSFRYLYSFYWINFVKYIKVFKIHDTGCYLINIAFATFISSRKDILLKFVKLKFWYVSSFWGDCKVFGKNIMTFWHNFAFMLNPFHYIWKLWLTAWS